MQQRHIYITDNIHSNILISSVEKEILSTQLFNRLHNISQNSTAYLTFPANRTKRFEHSLGTMKLCGDIFYHSVNNSDCLDGFFDCLGKEKCCSVNQTAIQEAINNVFYNTVVPNNIAEKNRPLYIIIYQAIRITGLTHDIGHPPFSHITESALGNILSKLKNKPKLTEREQYFAETLRAYEKKDGSSQLHETMGKRMADRLFDVCLQTDGHMREFKHAVFETAKAILNQSAPIFSDLYKIVSGILDGDRLDYTNRDMTNSGLQTGKINYERLISSMKLVHHQNRYTIAAEVKTIDIVEDFFLKRWNLYKSILYHHRVVKTDGLLQSSIEAIATEYLENEAPENCPDGYVLPYDISGLWKAVNLANSDARYFNSLIQWDDGWLLAVLKKHYFCDFYEKDDSAVRLQLEELLSNRKNFSSLVKNNFDFSFCSSAFDAAFDRRSLSGDTAFAEIELRYPEAPALYKLDEFFGETGKKADLYAFREFIKKEISVFMNKKGFSHHIVITKSISSGLDGDPFVYRGSVLSNLTQCSNIKRTLSSERFNFPYFYVYFHCREPLSRQETIGLLSGLGAYLAEETARFLNKF